MPTFGVSVGPIVDAVLKGRSGEHLGASFLCSVGWQAVLADAAGYDIIATNDNSILRVQVKSCSQPIIGKRERAPGWFRWTTGMGGNKELRTPTDYYDVMALTALSKSAITFIPAAEINKKTYRIHPDSLNAETSAVSWAATMRNLKKWRYVD